MMKLGFLVLLFVVSCVSQATRSAQNLKTLQNKYYNSATGLWNVGWWNSANSLEALIEYSLYSKDNTYRSAIQNTFQHTTTKQTENDAYDDAQWWAIAWIRAYQLTGEQSYRQRSADIWNYILHVAWDNHCGGGVWWSAQKTYKNAITNELFFVLSILLYQYDSNNQTYLSWAEKEWQWFESSGMINNGHLINDGLDGNCRNNGQTTWTYNQGVVLGGLAYLYTVTKNNSLLNVAQEIADAVYSSNLVHSRGGVLREPCEPNCGGDGPQFKGVFMRYLGILAHELQGAQQTKYITWVRTNSDSIWNSDRTADDTFGVTWVGPPASISATTQTSALDCFNAELLLGGGSVV